MALEIMTLASSSKGNCICVKNNDTLILLDMGISMRRLKDGLATYDKKLSDIDAVIITHEHNDHICGIKTLYKNYKLPIFAHKKAINIMNCCDRYSMIKFQEIDENGFNVKEFAINPFKTSHDSQQPLGFSVTYNNAKFSLATDLGFVSKTVIQNLASSDVVMIESNHDIDMLWANHKYPAYLKHRILSDKGHLNNNDCANILPELVESGVHSIILGHLSAENNTAQLAFSTSKNRLERAGFIVGKDVQLSVAPIGNNKLIHKTKRGEVC